jgi:hypothetical protein
MLLVIIFKILVVIFGFDKHTSKAVKFVKETMRNSLRHNATNDFLWGLCPLYIMHVNVLKKGKETSKSADAIRSKQTRQG